MRYDFGHVEGIERAQTLNGKHDKPTLELHVQQEQHVAWLVVVIVGTPEQVSNVKENTCPYATCLKQERLSLPNRLIVAIFDLAELRVVHHCDGKVYLT